MIKSITAMKVESVKTIIRPCFCTPSQQHRGNIHFSHSSILYHLQPHQGDRCVCSMSSLKYFTGDLFAHNEDLPNTYVKSSPHLTIFYSSNLILVGSCTWHCYTKSVIEQSLSLGPVARKFWFPADIHLSVKYQIRKSYLKTIFHDTTRKHDTLGLQRG